MSRLYFDLGNTRIKWWTEAESKCFGAFLYSEAESTLGHLVRQHPVLHEVVFASVVKDQRRNDFIAVLNQLGVHQIRECVVTAEALGVRCAYRDCSRLGIDRWLALLAGWSLAAGPCVVVDVGTAVTLDWVDRSGRHQGGFILPGLRLGIEALLQGTSNVLVDFDKLSQAGVLPGCNTTDAVYNGALFAQVATVEYALRQLQQQEPAAKLLITGGDGALVGTHLGCHYQFVEDLVFQGMRLLADQNLVADVSS